MRFAVEPLEFQMRLLVRRRFQERARIQSHQAAIAFLARGEQHQARQFADMSGIARIALLVAEIDRQTTTDDRLNAGARHLLGEFQRTEHVVGVGERERGLAIGFRELRKARNRERALEQRIGRMHMQMNKARTGHDMSSVILLDCLNDSMVRIRVASCPSCWLFLVELFSLSPAHSPKDGYARRADQLSRKVMDSRKRHRIVRRLTWNFGRPPIVRVSCFFRE